MNETNYTIDEILKAVSEINQDGKSIVKHSNKNNTQSLKNEIPVNTLRIILLQAIILITNLIF